MLLEPYKEDRFANIVHRLGLLQLVVSGFLTSNFDELCKFDIQKYHLGYATIFLALGAVMHFGSAYMIHVSNSDSKSNKKTKPVTMEGILGGTFYIAGLFSILWAAYSLVQWVNVYNFTPTY